MAFMHILGDRGQIRVYTKGSCRKVVDCRTPNKNNRQVSNPAKVQC